MTSLFSHSLLNDTDRDVRGAYKAFSRGTEHAAVADMGINDRSSADVSQLAGRLRRGRQRNGQNTKSCGFIS